MIEFNENTTQDVNLINEIKVQIQTIKNTTKYITMHVYLQKNIFDNTLNSTLSSVLVLKKLLNF